MKRDLKGGDYTASKRAVRKGQNLNTDFPRGLEADDRIYTMRQFGDYRGSSAYPIKESRLSMLASCMAQRNSMRDRFGLKPWRLVATYRQFA
jgi:hypothetical protein